MDQHHQHPVVVDTPGVPPTSDSDDDARLLEALRTNPSAAAELIDRIRVDTIQALRRSGWRDPEDIWPETLIRVLVKAQAGVLIDHPRGYIRGVARNVAKEIDRWAKRHPGPPLDAIPEPAAPPATVPDDEVRRHIRDCLARAKRADRDLLAAAAHGRSHRQKLRQNLGVLSGTFRKRLKAARDRFERCLQARGVNVPRRAGNV